MKNANLIRQLLKTAKVKIRASWVSEESRVSRFREIIEADVAIDKALALLPCETCNGTEIKPPEEGCGYCLAVDGSCWADCPCPDCQPKPKQEESSPSTMWEHLH